MSSRCAGAAWHLVDGHFAHAWKRRGYYARFINSWELYGPAIWADKPRVTALQQIDAAGRG